MTTPVYGKLADIWGRKRILLLGLGLFTVGSILSGRARSMPELIAMRVVQGLGAGAVGPIVLTLLGDLFSLEERAKVQGLFSAGLGAFQRGGALARRPVDRPTLVALGVLRDRAVLGGGGLGPGPARPGDVTPRRSSPIDWRGAALLASGSTLLLLAILRGPAASLEIGLVLGAAAWLC